MTRRAIGLLAIMSFIGCTTSSAQEAEISTKYGAIAIDVFPLLNQIFSDDGNTSLFQATYVWGKDRKRNEFGVSPQYRHVGGSEDISGFNSYGLGIEFFHGKTHEVGKRWRGTFGVTYRYRFNQSVSKTSGFGDSKITSTLHSGGIGPQFMFGYQISDKALIRSRISALVHGQDTKTKIKDGPFEAGSQNITTIDFQFNAPSMLELVLFF